MITNANESVALLDTIRYCCDIYNSTNYFENELPHLQTRQYPRVWNLWQTNAQSSQSICTVSPQKHSLFAYTKYGRNRIERGQRSDIDTSKLHT